MRPILLFAALMLSAVACSAGDSAAEDTLAAAEHADVVEAARVADAMERTPAAADSILRAAGYTVESFEQLMYEIAADSAKAAVYASARAR